MQARLRLPRVIHPMLFAVFPVLFLYTYNIGKLSPSVLILPLTVIICVTAAVWAGLNLALKDNDRAGLIVSMILLMFFSYGHLSRFVRMMSFEHMEGGETAGAAEVLFLAWAAALILSVYLALRTRRDLDFITTLLNGTAIMLVAVSLINIGIYEFRTKGAWLYKEKQEPPLGEIKTGGALPNIYFIILDGYAREDVLREIYGYDNSPFMDFLEKNGFYVAAGSTSNYNQTGLSLASCLNLKYLNYLAAKVGADSGNLAPVRTMLRHNEAFRFLKQRGYTIAAFASGYHETEITNADVYITPGYVLDEFQNALINTTPVPSALSLMNADDQYDIYRKRILFITEHLADTARLKGPIFIFAHIEAPHPPFVFGPSGEEIDPEGPFTDYDGNWLIRKGGLTRQEYIKGYRGQVEFINKRMEAVIKDILRFSEKPPVIVLQADHGPRSMLVWEDPEKSNLKEALSILNAYYFPDGDYKDLYRAITPVNTFRVIFNGYFGADYELLVDKSYFSTPARPYDFIRVTDRVRR